MRNKLVCLFAALLITLSVSAQDVVLEKVENGHRVEVFALNNTNIAQEVTLDLTLVSVAVDKELPVVMVIPAEARVKMITLTPEPLEPWSYKTRYNFKPHIVEEIKPAPVATRPEPELPANKQPVEPERTFEEGPDIEEQESYDKPPVQSTSEIAEKESFEEERAKPDLPPPTPSAPVKPSRIDDGVMGPPLSTDDMPIPARYYEQPVAASEVNDEANVFEIPAESVVSISNGSMEKVIVYGQPGCPRCKKAKDYFVEQHVPFQYLDITVDQEAKDEMTERLFDSGFTGGQFIMPVVYVDDIAHYSIKELDVFLESLTNRD